MEILKEKLSVITQDVVKQSKKFADTMHLRECKKLEDRIDELKKSISNMKQVGFIYLFKWGMECQKSYYFLINFSYS